MNNNYDLEYEKQKHPYGTEGNVYEETHGNATFLMTNALRYVIDAYDEYLGSVEASHYEKLHYNKVIHFNLPEDAVSLDLTWMDSDDVFEFSKVTDEQYSGIKEVKTNIDNLAFSYLPMLSVTDHSILLEVNCNGTKASAVQQIKDFTNFVKNHSGRIIAVKTNGFAIPVESIIKLIAKKYGIDEYTEIQDYGINIKK